MDLRLWDVVIAEPAHPKDAKAMEVVAPIAAIG
jgi:hypothetical protein